MAEFQDNSPSPSPQQQATPDQQQDSLHQDSSPSLPESQESHSSDSDDEITAALKAVAEEQLDGEGENGETGAAKGIPEIGEPEGPKSEDAAPVPPAPDKVKPSALARFHRQEKEFLQKQQAFAAEKAEVEKFKSVLENAKQDRLAALELMGYSDVKSFLESIVEDGGRMTPERAELQKLKKWREDQEAQTKQQQEQYRAQQQQAAVQAKLDHIRAQVQNTIKSETYAGRLINLQGSDEQVMAEMDKMAVETGEMPSIDDAIERVEKQFQSYLEEMAGNERIRAFFQEKLRPAKSGPTVPAQSKLRGNSKTIGSDVRSPGLRSQALSSVSDDGEKEEQEAIAFLKSLSF